MEFFLLVEIPDKLETGKKSSFHSLTGKVLVSIPKFLDSERKKKHRNVGEIPIISSFMPK